MIVDAIASLHGARQNGKGEKWSTFEIPAVEMSQAIRMAMFDQQEVFVFYFLQDNSLHEIGPAKYNGLVQTPKGAWHISIRGERLYAINEHAEALTGVSFVLRLADVASAEDARVNDRLTQPAMVVNYGGSDLARNGREDLVPDELALDSTQI